MTAADVTRLLRIDDAAALTRLVTDNRANFAPWEPLRDPDFYTVDGQRAVISSQLDRYEFGLTLPHVILDEHGGMTGRITLDGITRGAFQSCTIGYWVALENNGRGLATAAVTRMMQIAFDDLGLHRIEAGTLVDNFRSQRVLAKNGFIQYGRAPQFLKIAGRWQDHMLFQRLNPAA